MTEYTYKLNPITGAIVPVDDAPMETVVTEQGKELWTHPSASVDESTVIIDFDAGMDTDDEYIFE